MDTKPAWLAGALLIPAVCLTVVLAAPKLLPSGVVEKPLLLPVLLLAGAGGLGAVLFYPRSVFLGFLLACMTMPFVLEETNVPLGFMKLYIQDLVFVYTAALIAVRTSLGQTVWKSIPFNRLVVVHFLLGVWATFVGLKLTAHSFDYTLGDFRRAFFYFMNYFVVLLLTDNLRDVRRLRWVLAAGGIILIFKGFLQSVGGQFYTRRFGDPAHILSHFELTFLSFVIFLSICELLFSRTRSRWVWGAVAFAGGVVTLVGNYRAAWLGLTGGMLFLFWYLPRRGKLMLAGLSAAGIVLLGLVLALLWDVQVEGYSTLGQDIMTKADFREAKQDTSVSWRLASYDNAYGLWKLSPWIGRGLGEEMEFTAPTSTGAPMIMRGHRVHNSFLWLLMSLGAIGFAVFAAVQAVYFYSLVRYLRWSEWTEGRITVLTCGAFYISFMISTSFEIFLESAMTITVLTATMALAMLTIWFTPKENEEHTCAV